ncbi:hypothetical protein C8J57DRAFT_1393239, partial [Mycena rebaudengoi]
MRAVVLRVFRARRRLARFFLVLRAGTAGCAQAWAQSQARLRAGDVRCVRLNCAQSVACTWGYTPSPRARLFLLFRRSRRSEL